VTRRRTSHALGLVALWVLTAGATPLPLTAPPPDITPLVSFTQAPLEKPRVEVPDPALPAPPVGLPSLPPAPLVWPVMERPSAFITAPRGYPCVGAWLPIASQALECGKERFLKGEYSEAAKAFESAIQRGADREFVQQARYWLGEAFAHEGDFAKADWTFRQVGVGPVRSEWEVWATHASGWMALSLQDFARARDAFERVLAGAVPSPIQGWARHGLALAHYALGRYPDADRAWGELGMRGVPAPLAREYLFWYGESAGRVGDYPRAQAELRKFLQGGPHALTETARMRLGWWTLAEGRHADAIGVFKTYVSGPRRPATDRDAEWAEGGLALALAASGDWNAARDASRALTARRTPLAQPVALQLVAGALAGKKAAEAQALIQEQLAGTLTPALRTWLLVAKGDADRLEGNRDDARTQYDLAQKADPASDLGRLALFRLGRINFEMREFAQAAKDAASLLAATQDPDLKTAALLLQGEASYHAGSYAMAEAAYRRALVEFPKHPQAPAVRLSLGWVALRQNQRDEARQLFLDFARTLPDHPGAADALVLASELAIAAGELGTARAELERIITGHPMQARTDFARLNRAILMVRERRIGEAVPALRDWIARSPFPPLIGRAEAALGAALLAANQPGEAAKHFATAQREGVGGFASLGRGAAALALGQADEAARAFSEARETGTSDVAATAEYGLAAVALGKGSLRDFKDPALAALRAAPDGAQAPRLLYVLTGIAVEEKDWNGALGHARRLVADFPDHETADDAVERVGAGASKAGAWPVVYEAYSLLRQPRYARSPFLPGGRLLLAEAALHTGRADEARRELEQLVQSTPPADARPWMLLARAREATGERRGAIEAYERAAKDPTGSGVLREAQVSQARLLVAEKRWDQARAVLDPLLRSPDQGVVLEAAFSIGETYREEGDAVGAAEYYMTAAYLAPESPVGRKALLAAAQSFATAKHTDAAAVVYKKLLAQADLPGDVASAAKQGLQSLGR
jgi:tetratricopeptide (TPR) repeat protein